MALLDHTGRPLAPAAVPHAPKLGAPKPGGRASAHSQFWNGASRAAPHLQGWSPWPVSADGANLAAASDLRQRARDLVRNSGTAAAAARIWADMVVGRGWSVTPNPSADALGIDPDEARGLGRQFANLWAGWADDPMKRSDAEGKQPFALMLNAAVQAKRADGEILMVLRQRVRAGWPWRTAVQWIDPDRLSNPGDGPDTNQLRGGVEFDDWGEPVAYHIRNGHPSDTYLGADAYTWTRIPARDADGRPVVLHAFDPDRPGQSRGVSAFAPVISLFKSLGRYSEAELQSAVLQSLFFAFVKSNDPSAVAEMMGFEGDTSSGKQSWQEFRADYYSAQQRDRAGRETEAARAMVLPPGDEIVINTVGRAQSGFPAFRDTFLREMASGLGLASFQLSQDWGGVNYSSARAALNEVWKSVQTARAQLEAQIYKPVYFRLLCEAYDAGWWAEPRGAATIDEAPAAYTAAIWTGPGRGMIDGVKEAQAAEMRLESGLTTRERELAELGLTLNDVIAGELREGEAYAAAGLTPPGAALRDPEALAPLMISDRDEDDNRRAA